MATRQPSELAKSQSGIQPSKRNRFFSGRRRVFMRRLAAFLLLAIILLFWWSTVYILLVASWWLYKGYFQMPEEQVPYAWNGVIDWILMLLALVSVWPIQGWVRLQLARLMEDSPENALKIFSLFSQQLDGAQTLDEQMDDLVYLLARTLDMPYVSISLEKMNTAITYGSQPDRQSIRLPLRYNQRPLGTLMLAPRVVGGITVHVDERLLLDLARQISLTLYTRQLSLDLQESRARIVTAREEARRQLRQDLHDGLGPSMAAMTMLAETARELVYDDPTKAEQLLTNLVDQTQSMVIDIRRLVHGLRPPALDDVGLYGALDLLVGGFANPYQQTQIHLPDIEVALSAAMEVAIYRIVQEALTNVSKHAQADRTEVALSIRDDGVTLTVCDNGSGMPDTPGAGVGLQSMRERAEELGGTFSVRPNEPTGTCIIVRFVL